MRPIERDPLASAFLQRLAIGGDRLLQLARPALALPKDFERIAKTELCPRPLERNLLARLQLEQTPFAFDRRNQRSVIAEFVSLLVERVRFPFEIANAFVLMIAVRRKHRGRVGEVPRGLAISQSGQCDFAAPGGSLGGAEREAVERAPLVHFDLRKQRVGFVQLAVVDRPLRFGLEGGHTGVVADLCRCGRRESFVSLGNFDQLGGQALGRDVLFAENVQGGANLALVQIELLFENGDGFLLRRVQFLKGLGPFSDQLFELVQGNADGDC
ncbi:MAG: hypothetical protein WAU78_05835 [Roseiarcus sp.]